AYALLGEGVARLADAAFADFVDQRLIGPLGPTRTTWHSADPPARGYSFDPYARALRPESTLEGTGSRRSEACGALRPTCAAGRAPSPRSRRCTRCRSWETPARG